MSETHREKQKLRYSEISVPDNFIFHYFDTNDAEAVEALRYLEESGRRFDLGKGRAVIFHRAHVPNTQDHLHFEQRGHTLYAMNRDGSAHDGSHGKQMHRWAVDAVKDRYPGFKLPKDGLIETMFDQGEAVVLMETVAIRPELDRTLMDLADKLAREA